MINITADTFNNSYLPLHGLDLVVLVVPIALTVWIARTSREVGVPVEDGGMSDSAPVVATAAATADSGDHVETSVKSDKRPLLYRDQCT